MNRNSEKGRHPGLIAERLSIEVTSQCNMDCSHCFARSRNSKSYSLPNGLVKAMIREGYDAAYRHLHITGGEPLLWKGLFEMLNFAFKVGYQTVFLNTNGTVLTKDICTRLSAYEGFSMSVSLEGTEALNDRLRGKGSYAQIVRGIEMALDAGIDVSIFTTACKSLLPDMFHFTEDLYEKFPNIHYLTLIQLIAATKEAFALSDELLEPEDLLQLVKKVSVLNLLGRTTRFLNNPLVYVASKLLKILWIYPSMPLYCQGSLIVMANRDIGLAHSNSFNFGKYESGMIRKVLASNKYRKAVGPDEKTCPSCKYSKLCMQNGMIRPLKRTWGVPSDTLYCQQVLDSVTH